MDDFLVVGVIQGLADGKNDFNRALHGQQRVRVAMLFKGVLLDMLHGDIAIGVVGARIIDGYDIGVIQASGRLGFDEKFLAFVVWIGLGYFQGHLATDVGVDPQINDGIAALAEFAGNLVAVNGF